MSEAEFKMLKEFRDSSSQAEDAVQRLRKRLATVESMYRERMDDIRDLVSALELIADKGGKTIYHDKEDGLPPTSCNGTWCSEQAHAALDTFRAKPVGPFTLV